MSGLHKGGLCGVVWCGCDAAPGPGFSVRGCPGRWGRSWLERGTPTRMQEQNMAQQRGTHRLDLRVSWAEGSDLRITSTSA